MDLLICLTALHNIKDLRFRMYDLLKTTNSNIRANLFISIKTKVYSDILLQTQSIQDFIKMAFFRSKRRIKICH